MADFNFGMNEEGTRELEQQLQQQFTGGLQVPLGGSEADAIESVKEQLRNKGAEPNDGEVEKLVREARNG